MKLDKMAKEGYAKTHSFTVALLDIRTDRDKERSIERDRETET